MQENDVGSLWEFSTSNQVNQSRRSLAGVDGIQQDTLHPSKECHSFFHAFGRQGISRTNVFIPYLDGFGWQDSLRISGNVTQGFLSQM
jgi:hypothetical protein